jgi:transmembrane sensor
VRHRDDPENESIDWSLLHRHLAGETSLEDESRFAEWVSAASGRREFVESLRTMGESTRAQRPAFNKARAWNRMREEVDPASGRQTGRSVARRTPTEKPGAFPGTRAVRPLSTIAATIAVALGVGLTVRAVSHRTVPTTPGREYATSRAQRLSVMLADGTRLTLAPASRVRVAADYGRSTRELALEGEALFNVRHDDAHPFRVVAANAVTEDIGTRFVVRAYTGDNAVRIAVAEGRVSLTRRGGRVTARVAEGPEPLGAGDLATVTGQGITVTHDANLTGLVAWTQGRLVFDRTPLRDAVQDLARTFDMDITVSDSTLLDQRVTGAFGDDERVDDVLTAVAVSVGAHVERAGRRVAIRRGAGGLTHTDPLRSPPMLRTARAEAR